MTPTTSRFADLARWQALAIVAVLVAAITGGIACRMQNNFLPGAIAPQQVAALTVVTNVAGGIALSNVPVSAEEIGDLALYRRVTLRLINGASYYPTAADEHRKSAYPLRPFITVRMPTLALVSATFGLSAMRGLLVLLVLLAGFAWWRRLQRATDCSTLQPVIGALAVATGLVTFVSSSSVVVSHEVWAATLMSVSWAMLGGFRGKPDVHSVRAWLPSVLLAAASVLIRETALPFVLLMGAFAVWRRHWLEAAGWACSVLVFAACLALHAGNVAAVTSPADGASPGWANFSGWPFFVLAMHGSTAIRILPEWSAAIAVSLTMLGWASWRSETGAFGFLLFAGYALVFMVLGRPDNWYWGLLISPLFLLGLMFAPQGIADLVAAICGTPDAAKVSGARVPSTDRQWPTISGRPAAAR
jgi:hypothetical protein